MSLLLALGVVGVLMQSTAAPPAAVVSGVVLEDGTRAPIAGAQVMLMPTRFRPGARRFMDRPRTAITDQSGRYTFDAVETGRFRLMVTKAGFAPMNEGGSAEVDLAAGGRREVNVTLQKGAVIVGRVIDENGEPLANAQVMAMRRSTVSPGTRSEQRDFMIPGGPLAQTNDLGEFRLFSLPAGEYFVHALPGHAFEGSHSPRSTTMMATYFPGTTDRAAAQAISVDAGQTSAEIVIRMISAAAFRVSGVVSDEGGKPVANAMVRLSSDEAAAQPPFMMASWNRVRTDASGRFTIDNVTNGTYTLLAVPPVVISRAAGGGGAMTAASGGGTFTSFVGLSAGVERGSVGGGVTTETMNGTTIEYRDDNATRVPITINDANVNGLAVIVRSPKP
jgi:protocatechuate 3,4-dioxygenase beta subunit